MSKGMQMHEDDCFVCGFSEWLYKTGCNPAVGIDSDNEAQGSITICIRCIPRMREKLSQAIRKYKQEGGGE